MNQVENKIDFGEFFFNLMSKRRSIRSFSKTPIDKKIIINAIKTAATAPSGANAQPWYFVLVTDQEIKNQIRSAAEEVEHQFYTQDSTKNWVRDLLPLGTNSLKPFLSEAPALIVVFSKTHNEDVSGEMKKTYYQNESCGIAVGILITALHQLGLGTLTHTPRPMLFLNKLFNLSGLYKPYMIVVTGHPDKNFIPPKISRKNLNEVMASY